MRSLKTWCWAAGLSALLALHGCGGSGSSSGDAQVRLVNATRTHGSIDLIANLSSVTTASTVKQVNAVPMGAASTYVALGAGSYGMQVTDTGSLNAVATTSPSLIKDVQYTLLAYESDGSVKTSFVTESSTAPSSGASLLRVYDAATNAGTLDVYVTAPNVDLASVGSPSFTIGGTSTLQISSALTYVPGSYRVRVTGSGNVSDVRLDIPSISLLDQQNQYLVLTPTAGGGLVNGAVLVEKGAYSAYANANARVRLVSGASSGLVAATVGALTVEAGAQSPTIGAYMTVPSGSAAWTITLNGNAVAVPPITLGAGTDNTVLVTGAPAASVASLIVDDSVASATTTGVNLRLVNGLTGSNAGLSLSIDFALVANNVLPGASSGYKSVTSNSNMRLEVDSPLSSTPLSLQTALSFPAGGAYSVFVIGDSAQPVVSVRRDR